MYVSQMLFFTCRQECLLVLLEVLETEMLTTFQDGSLVESRILCIQHTVKECQSKWDETLHNTAEVLVAVIILIRYFVPKSETSTMQETTK